MKLCQYYGSEAARKADLERRFPTEGRLGVLIDGRIVDITERASRHNDINSPQYAGILAAAVAGCDEWATLREEIKSLNADGGLDPTTVYFGPCVPRPAQFMDFYAFEQHVKAARKLRGLDFVEPAWYEIPAYYNSNATSLLGHGMTAYYPPDETKMDYECELACVLGKSIRNATLETAREAIVGYTILNDLSSRARQAKAMSINMGPSPGKDFASSLGQYLVTKDEIADLGGLKMKAFVNNEQWTDGRFGTIHHSFESMVVYASRSRRLFCGDILGSGTVGGGCGLELQRFLKPGDTIRIEIDQLGKLENKVELDRV